MYSLNAPVPAEVQAVADDLALGLEGFSRREDPTVLLKRLDPDDRAADGLATFAGIADRVEEVLAGAPAVAVRVTGVAVFEDPPSGTAPVVYLSLESPGLHALHDRLCELFRPVPELEGEEYVPHVTVARDGPPEVAQRVAQRAVESVEWTVDELHLYDARHGEVVRRYSLPKVQ